MEPLEHFCRLFERSVDRWPNRLAVADDQQQWSYRQLQQQANQIAAFLSQQGMQPGDTVGLCVPNGAFAIAAMLGTWQNRGAFVPLDPAFPAPRLHYMVQDAAIRWVFCEPEFLSLFQTSPPADQVRCLNPADVASPTRQFDQQNTEPRKYDSKTSKYDSDASKYDSNASKYDSLASKADCEGDERDGPAAADESLPADDLAYIMYTSGSTGQPKGVEIDHRALAVYCWADVEVYGVRADDRTLQFGTLNFDISIEEIFPPLLVGSAVVVRPRQRLDAEIELSAIIDQNRITALHIAAAYWHEWVDLIKAAGQGIPQSLRLVIVTGEKVSTNHYRLWQSLLTPGQRQALRWCNAYGPTETTVTCTVFTPPADWQGENMPIGKPLKRYTAYILDADDQPLLPGVDGSSETGELYIGGPALARGYRNQPDKTAEAFRTLTFPDGTEHRLYKTGDLARWLPGGDIEFAGRLDHQIKLGSYRIEPQEIEYHLALHPDVSEALVVADEVAGRKCLTAYVARGTSDVTPGQLAQSLSGQLADYMIPHRYVLVDAFPKTINGKIDRRSLPPLTAAQTARSGEIELPRTATERRLAAIFADVLQLNSVGIHDDFFELGGSSLLVTRVISQIRGHFDLPIPVRDFFANPTVAMIAYLLDLRQAGLDGPANRSLPPAPLAAAAKPTLPTPTPFFLSSPTSLNSPTAASAAEPTIELFSVHYPPCQTPRSTGVLLVGPEGSEAVRAHRNLQQLAVMLSRAGADVLRWDWAGHGNSGGNPATVGPDQWYRDLMSAAKWLRQSTEPQRLIVIGMRLGATLAATAPWPSDLARTIEQLILVDPVRCGRAYIEMQKRFEQWELGALYRYDRRRRASEQQLHGWPTSAAKQAAIADLQIANTANTNAASPPPASPNAAPSAAPVAGPAIPTRVLTTGQYQQGEGDWTLPPTWQHTSCDDPLGWHQPQLAHSAFASPGINRQILQWVSEHPQTTPAATQPATNSQPATAATQQGEPR